MRFALAAALLFAVATPALAAGLSAKDAKKTFYGYDMSGYVEGSNEPWRECIHTSGETSYWYENSFDEGRLRVRDDGALCFSYKSSNYSREGCYTANRVGANWRFVNVANEEVVFVTTKTRATKSCPTNDPAVS